LLVYGLLKYYKIIRFINCKVTDTNLKYQNEQINLDNDDINFWSYHEKLINSNISQQIVKILTKCQKTFVLI